MKIRSLYKIVFLLLFMLVVSGISAQKKNPNFQIPGRIKVDKGDPSGSSVTVQNLESNQIVQTVPVSSSGKFDLELKYQTDYQLTFAKEGYYKKDIQISTLVPKEVWEKDSVFPPYQMVITLYQQVPDVKLSFENKLIGKVSYSPDGKLDNFDARIYIDDKDIRDEIDLALKKFDNSDFDKKLAEALEFEKDGKLESALAAYTEASKMRSDNKFVKEKIKELTADIKDLQNDAKKQAEFERFIALGDENVVGAKYTQALIDYRQALNLKPQDQVALDRIASTEQLLAGLEADKAKSEAEFSRLLALGDENMKAEKYTDAITDFKGALNAKPKDPTATAKLKTAEQLLTKTNTEKAKLESEFNRLMASGDENVKSGLYAQAVADFKGALNLKQDDSTATAKLAAAEQLLAKANAENEKLDAEFNRLLASGDENMKAEHYSNAVDDYKNALNLKLNDRNAASKLASAEQLLAKSNADKEKLDAEFKRLLASGDENVKAEKYPNAITDFKNALMLKPGDSIATAKLTSVEQLLAKINDDKAKLDAEFSRLLSSGDENVKIEKYTEAVADFKGALGLKPKDASVAAKLASAEKLLARANANRERSEAEYARLLASGDENVKVQKYVEAITDFKGALNAKPNDTIATSKLVAAEHTLAKINEDKARLDAEFGRLIVSGDENVKSEKYPEAITDFKSALDLKPGDVTATSKLATVEKLLARTNANKERIDAEFNRFLTAGDELVKVQKYPEAIANFKAALNVKPNEATATAKLTAAEQLLAKTNADKAKSEAEFTRLLASGDGNMQVQKYSEAITDFKAALDIKPYDAVAKTKLALAEQLLAKTSADKAKLEAEFSRLIASGDENVKAIKYPEAITDYKSALNLKPNEPTSTAKLAAAEQLLAKANDEKQRAELEKQALAEKMQKYNAAIEKADRQFAAKLYPEAKTEYQSASAIDITATYPKQKIAEIDRLVAQQLAAAELARQNTAEKQKNYDDAIKSGDTNFDAKKWQESITAYTKAVEIQSEQVYPKNRIEEAKKIIASEALLDKSYQEEILKGGKLFDSQKYNESLLAYKEAQKLKPEEVIPPQKIAEIQSIIDDLKVKQLAVQKQAEANKLSVGVASYQNNIKLGDDNFQKTQWSVARFYYTEALKFKADDKYALDKINTCDNMTKSEITAEKMAEFKSRVQKGDQAFDAKNYSSSRFYYRNALEIMPWDEYPKEKLKEIDAAFAKNMSDSEQKLFAENLEKADAAFEKKEYPVARFYYNKANEINPDQYVDSRLKEIESIVSGKENGRIEAEYKEYIQKADEAFEQKSNSVARFYYQKALVVKPNEAYPKQQMEKIKGGQ